MHACHDVAKDHILQCGFPSNNSSYSVGCAITCVPQQEPFKAMVGSIIVHPTTSNSNIKYPPRT